MSSEDRIDRLVQKWRDGWELNWKDLSTVFGYTRYNILEFTDEEHAKISKDLEAVEEKEKYCSTL